MKTTMLSGDYLWPPSSEVEALIDANAADNPVEAVMRLRALVELSEKLDTKSLLALASFDPERHGGVMALLRELTRLAG